MCNAQSTRTWPAGRTVASGTSCSCGSTTKSGELTEGPILQKAVTPCRAYVAAPMNYGRLYLAGDAVHIVPPTGAKGLNLAAADIRVLSRALIEFFRTGSTARLDRYSETCLKRVWKGVRYSNYMTSLLHRFDEHTPFERQVQQAELEYIARLGRGADHHCGKLRRPAVRGGLTATAALRILFASRAGDLDAVRLDQGQREALPTRRHGARLRRSLFCHEFRRATIGNAGRPCRLRFLSRRHRCITYFGTRLQARPTCRRIWEGLQLLSTGRAMDRVVLDAI